MNTTKFNQYEKEIQQLIRNCERLSVISDPSALRHLKKLEKVAKQFNDNDLFGYTYFYLANWYYDYSKYDKFHKYLNKAIHFLLRSDNHTLLARSYNLFAIEAQYNGAVDVAYNYYINALLFANASRDNDVSGIIHANLASLYYAIGDYPLARKYFHKGIRDIQKNKQDPYYLRNLMVVYTNDGVNSIVLKDMSSAEKSFSKAKKIYLTVDKNELRDAILAYKFFELRLSLAKNEDYNAISVQTKEILDLLKEEKEPHIYMDDIHDFLTALMNYKQLDTVNEILNIINEKVVESKIIHAMRLLIESKVDYYDCINDESNLIYSLREQHQLLLLQQEEIGKIYQLSIELIKLVGDLEEEKERVRLENLFLQQQAQTDTLTGLANRHALVIALNQTFETAFQNKTNLAVEIMDVDKFKDFNDHYGHQAGDACLEVIGKVLKEISIMHHLYVARYGGDEFVILYENKSNEEILSIAKEIASTILNQEIEVHGKQIKEKIILSQGICNDVPKLKNKPWDFLTNADEALYAKKASEDKQDKIMIKSLSKFKGRK